MAIDPSIALQVQPPANPLAQYAQLAQLQNMQTQGRMADLQVQGAQRAQERQNKLSQLLSGQYATPDAREQALLGGGFVDESLKIGKDRRENTKTDLGNEETRQKLFTGGLNMIVANPTQQTVMAVLDDLEKRTGKPAGPAKQIFSQAQTPEQITELAKRMGIELEKQMPSFQSRNTGGSTDTLSIDPITGKVAVANSVQNTQSPDNKASVGASYANAAATRAVAASNVEAAKIKGDRDTEMKIADDYRAQSKDFKAVGDAYKQISATLDKATTSPAATLAAATKFMKLLDPGSVVRESELGMALAATGVFDRATNYVNTLKYGKVLTPSQAADFKNITAQIYGAAQAGQKQVDDSYRQTAKTYGLRPEMIVQDLGQNAPATAAQPTGMPKGFKVIRD